MARPRSMATIVQPRPQLSHGPTAQRRRGQQHGQRSQHGLSKTGLMLLVAIALIGALVAYAVGQARATPAGPIVGPAASLVGLTAVARGPDVLLNFVFVDRDGRDTTFAGGLSGAALVHGQLDWQLSRSISPAESAAVPDPLTAVNRPTLQLVIPASAWTRRPDQGAQLTLSLSATPASGAPFTATAATAFPGPPRS
jgi:hypothetical protein